MKQKQRIALFGMVAVALIFAACGGDSGNNTSSSSVGVSSSSLVVSSLNVTLSSSSSIEYGSLTYGEQTYKTVTYTYGSQTYKTVTIGTQTWMVENLNYADSASTTNLKGNSWCYEDRADNCVKYGRLYTSTGAMNLASSYQSAVISTLQQGVCPTGWHIPTNAEWTTLKIAVGGSSTAGTALKSASGWSSNGNGTDTYGFSTLPAGYRNLDGSFGVVGDYANFWSATEGGTGSAYDLYLG